MGPVTWEGCHNDHPDYIPNPGRYSLVVDPIVGNTRHMKVVMDGGSSLNIIYVDTLELMGGRAILDLDRGHTIPRDQSLQEGASPRADRPAHLLQNPPTSERKFLHLKW